MTEGPHSKTRGPSNSEESSQRWLRLRELFLLATESAPPDRREFLDRHCGDDGELRQELEALLESDDEGTRPWLKEPLVASEAFRTPEAGFTDSDEWIPERVGPYLIKEKLGGGGMGSVWLAELDAPFPRQVAIKFPQGICDDEEGVLRFLQEMRLLASLDHPGVTRVLDAGRTSRGGPWFAMERVEGDTIDGHCDGRQLALVPRLRLFLEVCEAVHHAHQRGIVHLDIKPANVLVEQEAGAFRVRLIDFGIARLIRGSTPPAQRPAGTLAFMSPEQATAEPGKVDIRSDVYSLGVLLRTLLVASQSNQEFPSQQARSAKPEALAARSTNGLALSRALTGDLDWIITRATQPDPGDRYDSVSTLMGDLRRHLEHEPLVGFRTPLGQRLRKSLRRHRPLWIASFVAGLGISVGAVGLGRAWWSAREQHRAEVVLRNQAQEEAERARRSKAFLAGTLSLANPRVTMTPDLSARAVLDDASMRVGEAFPGDPLGEATIRQAIGDAYRSLGELEEAATHLTRAVELLEEGGAPHSLAMYDALWSLVFVYDETNFRQGLVHGRRAVELRLALLEQMNPELSLAISAVQTSGGLDRDDAQGKLQRVVALARALPEEHRAGRRLTAEAIADIGFFMGTFFSDDRAPAILDAAADLLGEEVPATHPDRTRMDGWKVQLLLDQRRWAEAVALMETLISTYDGVMAPNHWRRLEAQSRLDFARAMEFCEGKEGVLQEEKTTLILDMLDSAQALLECRGPSSHSTLEARVRIIEWLELGGDSAIPAVADQQANLLHALRDSDHFGFSWRVLRAAVLPLGVGDPELDRALDRWMRTPAGSGSGLPGELFQLCERVAGKGGLPAPKSWLVAELLLNATQNLPRPESAEAIDLLGCAIELWGSGEQAPILLGADLHALRCHHHAQHGDHAAAIRDGLESQRLYARADSSQAQGALWCNTRVALSLEALGKRDEARERLAGILSTAEEQFGRRSPFVQELRTQLRRLDSQ